MKVFLFNLQKYGNISPIIFGKSLFNSLWALTLVHRKEFSLSICNNNNKFQFSAVIIANHLPSSTVHVTRCMAMGWKLDVANVPVLVCFHWKPFIYNFLAVKTLQSGPFSCQYSGFTNCSQIWENGILWRRMWFWAGRRWYGRR